MLRCTLLKHHCFMPVTFMDVWKPISANINFNPFSLPPPPHASRKFDLTKYRLFRRDSSSEGRGDVPSAGRAGEGGEDEPPLCRTVRTATTGRQETATERRQKRTTSGQDVENCIAGWYAIKRWVGFSLFRMHQNMFEGPDPDPYPDPDPVPVPVPWPT